jgi:hypothetical protein
LIVDDFDDVTADLLRSAYVEAMYRLKDFEFNRLTQSFWWSAIANISSMRTTQPLLDTFPMAAVDENFARPRELFDCHTKGTCGTGTKRIPKKSC